jgi:hypothetical protein
MSEEHVNSEEEFAERAKAYFAEWPEYRDDGTVLVKLRHSKTNEFTGAFVMDAKLFNDMMSEAIKAHIQESNPNKTTK